MQQEVSSTEKSGHTSAPEVLPVADREQLEQECAELRQQIQDEQSKYLRALAEFDNFRKRVSKEQEEHARFAGESILKNLLPVLDDFDRILDHVPLNPDQELKQLVDGVDLVRKNLFATLEKNFLRVVETEGKLFDPTQHEAIAAIESDANPETILAVHRKGYWLGERLLRPALVTIAKGK